MRIFTAVRHSSDPSLYYGALWSGNFHPALKQLGHEVIESQTDLLPASRFMHIASHFTPEELMARAEITQHIIEEVGAAHGEQPLDLFLSYFYNSHFDPTGFDEVRRMGIPSVNFYCNSIYQFDLVSSVAPKADYAWHAERDARRLYLKIGANPVWVQMGADPAIYRPLPETRREPKACFVGQRYADRDRWVGELIRSGVPVNLYGPGWSARAPRPQNGADDAPYRTYLGRAQPKAGSWQSYISRTRNLVRTEGPLRAAQRLAKQVRYRRDTKKLSGLFAAHARGAIPFERIAEVFAAHEVCLNFSNVWADGAPGSELIPHVRLRDFEGPMCRTCYLTGESDEIHEFYDVGREIDTYSSEQELVEKTRFYLSNPEAAEALRRAGYQRAVSDHTWVRRFEELFSKIGLGRQTAQATVSK